MSRPRLRRHAFRASSPGIVEYGSLYLLLVALTLTERLLVRAVRALGDVPQFYVAPRLFWTVVYAAVGVTVLGVGYVVYHRTLDTENRLDSADRTRVALALWLLLLGGTYFVFGRVDAPGSTTGVVGPFVVSVAGMGLLAVAYCRLRDVELRLALPARSAAPTVGVAVLAPVLVVALLVVAHLAAGESSGWPFGVRHARSIPLVSLVGSTLIAPTFSAFGTGLLFHGAIQETLRESGPPTEAVVGTTALFGLYAGTGAWMPASVFDAAALLSVAAIPALVVVVAALVARAWRTVGPAVGDDASGITTATAFGVAAVALLLAGSHSVFGSTDASVFGYLLGHVATVGVAATTYERTRSVWVPVAALAAFYVAVDLVRYLPFPG